MSYKDETKDITEFQAMVDEFGDKVAAATGAEPPCFTPHLPEYNEAVRLLKIKLEEDLELIKGLGIDMLATGAGNIQMDRIFFQKSNTLPDMVQIADGIADSIYTSFFMASLLGISLEDILIAVAKNNLEKFGPGGHLNDDGKWVKPVDHKAPDIAGLLKEQGYDDGKIEEIL